jgi:hypothetical protein
MPDGIQEVGGLFLRTFAKAFEIRGFRRLFVLHNIYNMLEKQFLLVITCVDWYNRKQRIREIRK